MLAKLCPDIRAIRSSLQLSQLAFAREFGFSHGSIRDWEQGRRRPEQAARTLLLVIAHDPAIVRSALASSVAKIVEVG
jgi:putative transcriptional regulator